MFKKLMQSIDRMLGRGVIDEELYEELEEALLAADTHVQTVGEILEELRRAVRDEDCSRRMKPRHREHRRLRIEVVYWG